MAEEKNYETTNSDDVSVLRDLLHAIRGLSPVSSTSGLALVSVEETDDASNIDE